MLCRWRADERQKIEENPGTGISSPAGRGAKAKGRQRYRFFKGEGALLPPHWLVFCVFLAKITFQWNATSSYEMMKSQKYIEY